MQPTLALVRLDPENGTTRRWVSGRAPAVNGHRATERERTLRSMLLTRFIPCVSCERVVRVFDSRLRQTVRSDVQLPEDAATSGDDGAFECPFCGTRQLPPKP